MIEHFTLDKSEQLQEDINFFMKVEGYPNQLITELCQVVINYQSKVSKE